MKKWLSKRILPVCLMLLFIVGVSMPAAAQKAQKKSKKEMAAEIEQLLEQNKALQSQLDSLKTANKAVTVQRDSLGAANGTLRAENESLAAQRDSLSAANDTLSAQHEAFCKENKTLAAENNSLKKKIKHTLTQSELRQRYNNAFAHNTKSCCESSNKCKLWVENMIEANVRGFKVVNCKKHSKNKTIYNSQGYRMGPYEYEYTMTVSFLTKSFSDVKTFTWTTVDYGD